jgi:putative methyltransferase (TIGR04325 family)
MSTAKQLLRRLPGVSGLLEAIGYEGWRYCHGVHRSFAESRAAIPSRRKVGFDNLESADLYAQELDRVKPSDYAAFFWLRPLLPEIRRVFDFGGNKGWAYYAFRRYLTFPEDFSWTVYDVPAVVSAGQKLAPSRNASHLAFTTSFSVAEGCDLFYTSGTLQFVEQELAELLSSLKSLPPHLLINRVPLSAKPTYFTVHDFGPGCCPYRIANHEEFCKSLKSLNYEIVDSWPCAESWCKVRGRPSHQVRTYTGFYLKLIQPPENGRS